MLTAGSERCADIRRQVVEVLGHRYPAAQCPGFERPGTPREEVDCAHVGPMRLITETKRGAGSGDPAPLLFDLSAGRSVVYGFIFPRQICSFAASLRKQHDERYDAGNSGDERPDLPDMERVIRRNNDGRLRRDRLRPTEALTVGPNDPGTPQ